MIKLQFRKLLVSSLTVLTLVFSMGQTMYAQSKFQKVSQILNNPDNEPRPVFPVPSVRQIAWNETEFYAFFHFGMNTFTGKEWGYGDENVNTFAPTAKPNPRQWLEAAKAAGMKGGIAVVKHHDGFCLWPTSTTTHNSFNSSSANAQVNIPQEFATAAKELGMKYGFYVSPWDRNSELYGTDRYVKEVFLKQCEELAAYGNDQFEMWFDGANGGDGYYGGKRTTIQVDEGIYYDVPNLRYSIHKLCPNIILWGVGGEARWIGNEAGWAGETNWAYGDNEYGNENGWYWNAGESDAKATTGGWFYHWGEGVKSANELFKMYLETVGRNATLILNFPPDKSGFLPDYDVTEMNKLGNMLRSRFGNDLAKTATITVSDKREAGDHRNYEATNMTDGNKDTYWAANDGNTNVTITLQWATAQTLRYVTLMEYIKLGQRVKSFVIETSNDGSNWTKRGGNIQTTTIGYKRIIPLNGSTADSYSNPVSAKYLRVRITAAKACPTLHTLSVF